MTNRGLGWILGGLVFFIIWCIMMALISCPNSKADVAQLIGTTNIDDAYITELSPHNNYGATTVLSTDLSPYEKIYIRVKNLASELGENATITEAYCSLYCSSELGGATTIHAREVHKPWVEGTQDGANCTGAGITWNDWNCDTYEWTTAGGQCAGDDGSDNSCDGGVCDENCRDRVLTSTTSVSVNSTGWYSWTIPNALAQAWYSGAKVENGLEFQHGSTSYKRFNSSENGSNPPRFYFVYTVGAAEGQVIIINFGD